MSKGCVRTDNVSGTKIGKDLVSIRFQPTGADAEIENGAVVLIGEYISAEVRKGTAPAANSDINKIAIIASPEVVKSEKYNSLDEFVNEAGVAARGYRPRSGDIFSFTAEALDGTAKVGSVVELQAGTKLKVVESATESSTTVGTVIALEGKWIVVEIA